MVFPTSEFSYKTYIDRQSQLKKKNFARQEFEEFRDCVKNQKENFSETLNESCFLSTLIQAISCKEQIVKCLKKFISWCE